MVCRSVCNLVSPAKMAEAIDMPFALRILEGKKPPIRYSRELPAEYCIVWAFHTIQPSSFLFIFNAVMTQ